MKCNCIAEIEKKLAGTDFNGKEIISAKLVSSAIIYDKNSIELITTSEFEMEVEGLKRKKSQSMLHNFCPFCGRNIKAKKREDTGYMKPDRF